jgi:hypothetical protein
MMLHFCCTGLHNSHIWHNPRVPLPLVQVVPRLVNSVAFQFFLPDFLLAVAPRDVVTGQ